MSVIYGNFQFPEVLFKIQISLPLPDPKEFNRIAN